MTARFKTTLYLLFPTVLLLLALCFPTACSSGVKEGLDVAVKSALPALFPALVLSRMLARSASQMRGRTALFLPLWIGLICGFPAPAAVVAELSKEGVFSRKQGEKMLFFCNCASPAFLILLCGQGLMGNTACGWFLWILQSFLSLFFFFLFFHNELKRPKEKTEKEQYRIPLTLLFSKALSEAVGTFLTVGATILFFSFFHALLCTIIPFSSPWDAILSLFWELTGGVSALSNLQKETAFPLCAAGVGFGGVAVYVQTLCVLEGSGLTGKHYLKGKLLFSLLLAIGAQIFQKCL
ncbi:MAG: hypothetical protein IKJ74_00255 [Clostridia bacterium]|nr:hypothetical protein [Clostridia bacterium]